MNISSNGWSLSLDLSGGRIKELSHSGVKVFGTYNRIDGKQGNTHLCVPSFDKEGMEKWGLPFHGLVRNCLWSEEHRTENELSISTQTEPSIVYPASLKVEQTFTLSDVFTHTVAVSHISGNEVPLNIGVHYYWDTPKGWNDTQINNANIKANIETNGTTHLESKNKIVFPHATYELTSSGFNTAVLWTSFKTSEKGDKTYSQDFCCIEPVLDWPGYFGSEGSVLKNGEKKIASLMIGAGERT